MVIPKASQFISTIFKYYYDSVMGTHLGALHTYKQIM